MWFRILKSASKRNGWKQLCFYLSNLDVWRFIEYSQAYEYINKTEKDSVIIDLGGGYTSLPSLFPINEYVVLDINRYACAYQEKHGTKAIAADITKLPLATACADIVVAISSIEHLHDDHLAYKEIARILNERGVAVVSVPFSCTESKTIVMVRSSWQITILNKWRKFWKFLLGDMQLQYFLGQIATDSIEKYYCMTDLQKLLTGNGLCIVEYHLFGGKLLRGFFKIFNPGWFVLKDLLIGKLLYKLENIIYRNNLNAAGIILKLKKNNQWTEPL